MAGCTTCGAKQRCDSHKGEMMAALDEALVRLYPTKRWGEIDDVGRFRAGLPEADARELTSEIAEALDAAAFFRPGTDEEYCDSIYILCMGRRPCLLEIEDACASLPSDWDGSRLEELYLCLSLSNFGRLGTVQQVAFRLEPAGRDFLLSRLPRAGVYDAPLLNRFQKLVALLPQWDIVSVDFGDIAAPPEGYDPGEYASFYGGAPDIVNYLFYPQPAAMRRFSLLPRTSDAG